MVNLIQQQNIPSGWKQVALGDLVSITTGKRDANHGSPDGQYPFFTCAQKVSKIDNFAFDTEAILIAGNGDFNVKYYKGKFDAYQRTYVLSGFKDTTGSFIYQKAKQALNEIIKNNQGSSVKFIKMGDLTDYPLLLPPIKEQQKIAEILETVDEDIAKTKEVIGAIEKLKRGLMQQLFTRGIGHAKFKETKMGQIPEEWEVQKLERFIKSLDAGVSVNSRDVQKEDGEIGILKTSAVTFGVFDQNQHKTVVSEEVARVAVPVKADRLIVSRMNTRDLVGANAYTDRSFPDLFLPDRLWQVEPNDETNISMHWLSYIFNLLWKNGVFASLATGTSASMKNLSKGSILNMELAFPKIEEQKEIAEILSAVDEKISVNKKLKAKLTLLKKGLMQDLLSGNKRVKI